MAYRKNPRQMRHKRVRIKMSGTAGCPRVAVFRSHQYLYAQFIDDQAGKTLFAVSDKSGLKTQKNKLERAKNLGLEAAKQAEAQKIKKIVFDRGGFAYHGRIRSFAEGLREGGLEF